jgi:hypothetical protein
MTRIIGWLLAAFAVWYLLTSPASAAGVVLGILHGLHQAASSLSQFANQ